MENTAEIISNPHRERQLIQVWKDYYDEIYEINLDKGSYVSLMGNLDGTAKSGLIELEVILMSESQVHPDDRQAFRDFFDRGHVLSRVSKGEFVEKLYFRLKDRDGEYGYVKAKYMTPTIQPASEMISYVCFRRVDIETNKDMEYKRMLSDRIKEAEKEALNMGLVMEELSTRLRTPLSNISGIAGLAKTGVVDLQQTVNRLSQIEQAAFSMNEVLNSLLGDMVAEPAADPDSNAETSESKIDESMYTYRNDSSLLPEEQKKTSIMNSLPEGFFISSSSRNLEDGIMQMTGDGKRVLEGMNLLVAEDDETAASILAEILQKAGAQVMVVGDGRAAVTAFVSHPAYYFSAVLMELDLPLVDGWMATRCIRISGKDDADTIPVYAVTSRSYGEDVVKSCEKGMNAHFIKPVNLKVMFDKLIKLKNK